MSRLSPLSFSKVLTISVSSFPADMFATVVSFINICMRYLDLLTRDLSRALSFLYRDPRTMHMEKTYPYHPINNPREIRMLALSPAETGHPITCVLSHVCLDDDLEYEALSYTWDTDSSTQEKPKAISCSGHKMLVKPNLFGALQRLRYPDRPRALWIDAICINQVDNDEKNQQVALMGSVYANAKEVVVWLGEEAVDDALAFNTVIRLERIFINKSAESDLLRQMWNSTGGIDEIPGSLASEWRALSSLLRKRWFSRVWIVQEITLARKATLVCGSLTLTWERFIVALANLLTSPLRGILFTQDRPQGISTLHIFANILTGRDSQKPLGLFDLLVLTRDLQATDPRDKIFSPLSFLDYTGDDIEHAKSKRLWSLDYNIPVDDLFRKVTAYYLLDEGRSDILSLVNHGDRLDEHGEASWVLPRYIPSENLHEPLGFRLRATRDLAKPIGRYPCSHSDPSRISISGILVDKIRAVTTPIESSYKRLSDEKHLWVYCRRIRQYIAECETIQGELAGLLSGDVPDLPADAFWRTLMCNTTDSFLLPGLEFERSFSSWNEVLLRADVRARTGHDDYWSREDCQNLSAQAQPFERSFALWSAGRKFCTTNGKRLGMVPRAAHVGDIICAFSGAVTPFVLRPDGSGNYRLVGECYVHGLMGDESADLPGFMERLEDIVLV